MRQDAGMRLDHVSYVATPGHLADVVQRLGSAVGAAFADGGIHPRFGTRNFILPLAGGTYLEVVSTLDHPASDRAPFGQAVKQRAEQGGGWLGWVVAVDDIAPVEARIGRTAVDGNRHRPDGFDLRWRQVGVIDLIDDPQLPFFVQWLCERSEHPSHGASRDIHIDRMEICGDPDTVSEWLGEPSNHPLDNIEVDWVDGDEPGLVAVHLATAHGTVRID
jgi:Glyoxalase-like domain